MRLPALLSAIVEEQLNETRLTLPGRVPRLRPGASQKQGASLANNPHNPNTSPYVRGAPARARAPARLRPAKRALCDFFDKISYLGLTRRLVVAGKVHLAQPFHAIKQP